MHKNILVLSNNCFSESNSNGRTLGNLFYNYPKSNIAQLCVIANDPNWKLCDNYFVVEDSAVLRAFFCFKKATGRRLRPKVKDSGTNETLQLKFGKKTLCKVVLREFIWSRRRWESKSLNSWLNEFNPQMLVFQLGDSCFMLDIAYNIAKERNIPLVVYNTEGYYFFMKNWYFRAPLDKLFFPFYKRIYCSKVNRVMSLARHIVHLNDRLKEDYDKVFANPSSVIYNSSYITSSDKVLFTSVHPKINYIGNLGLDRDSALIDVGFVLQTIDPDYCIDIYGSATEAQVERFSKSPGLNYKGLVSYDKVREIINESDILLHVETEKGFKERQLQYAFSTKIADSLASGKCFVVFAPEDLACSEYIMNTQSGWLATNSDELRCVLINILNDPLQREEILLNAHETAVKNHDLIKNAMEFQNILCRYL